MFKVPEKNRILTGQFQSSASNGNNGQFFFYPTERSFPKDVRHTKGLFAQASDGAGWEHVSVSIIVPKGNIRRLPTHREMEFVRHQFWGNTDWVVEFHPPATEYVSNAPCLHLWRCSNGEFPTPNSILVGLK